MFDIPSDECIKVKYSFFLEDLVLLSKISGNWPKYIIILHFYKVLFTDISFDLCQKSLLYG